MQGYLSRGFFVCLIFAFVYLTVALTVTANQTFKTATFEEANQTLQHVQEERQTLTAQSIFFNNLFVSASLLIPAIGLIPFHFVWQNTAITIGLLAKATGIPPTTYVQSLIVLAFPEILAYTFLFAENIYTSGLALFKAGAVNRIKTQSWKTIIIWLTLLLIGAVAEAAMLG